MDERLSRAVLPGQRSIETERGVACRKHSSREPERILMWHGNRSEKHRESVPTLCMAGIVCALRASGTGFAEEREDQIESVSR